MQVKVSAGERRDDRTQIQQSANVFVSSGKLHEFQEKRGRAQQMLNRLSSSRARLLSAKLGRRLVTGGGLCYYVLQSCFKTRCTLCTAKLFQGAGVSGEREIEQSANAPGCLPRILPPGSVVHPSGWCD